MKRTREKDNIVYYKEAWKQTIGNFTKVYVKGTDYERGVRFGKLMAHEIRMVVKHFLRSRIKARGKESSMPWVIKWAFKALPFLLRPLLVLFYKQNVQTCIEKYPQWMVNELEGMAKGANIPFFYLKFINTPVVEENIAGAKELESLYRKPASCCSLAFTGQDGNIYHGKNLDWVPVEGFIDLICLQQREDEKGNWFAVIGPPGFLNAFEFGMNSHGIAFSLTGRFYRGKRVSKLVLTDVIELKILRQAKNLKEVKQIYGTRTGFNRTDALLISSAGDRDYKLFEVTPKGVAMTAAVDGKLFCTNTYMHPSFQSHNRQWGTIYNRQLRDPRYLRLQELMDRDPKTREEAFNILTDTVQPGFANPSFLGQATINRFITHISALMVQGQKGEDPGIWIARDRSYAAYSRYIFFDLSGKPREETQQRPANPIINTEKFKTFKDLIHLREQRYYRSPAKMIGEGKRLLEKGADNPIYVLFLAQNYLKYGKPLRALELLEEHPFEWTADYWYCRGKSYLDLGRQQEAGESFSKAMTLPPIDGFPEMVRVICLVQLVKINTALGLSGEVEQLKGKIKEMQAKFATPHIGMPDYPYINNIIEQMEEIVL